MPLQPLDSLLASREREAMSAREPQGQLGLDAPFEMKVEFILGQAADELIPGQCESWHPLYPTTSRSS
jgi:hypothetical protein